MTSDFAQKIRAYVEGAYRALVFICADDRPPKVPEAATVLGIADRTAEQLDGDVERLRSRRDDVAKMPELARLDEQVNQLSEQYRAATAKETEAKQRLDVANPPGVVLDLEGRKRCKKTTRT